MVAPAGVQELVEKFASDEARFRNANYNETQVRIEFIDPLFKILGWDVANSLQVVHEDRVSVIEGEKKKVKHPDYGFKIGRDVKFYVEAKKPSVDLQHDPDPAFQVRRYGWSKGLKLSVLTDFEEFIIYDCVQQPTLNDKSHIARVNYIPYTEYVERWDEISDLLSFEAVQAGAIEKFAQEELPKGTVTVDKAFLQEIETWRVLLAQDIALHNPGLTRRNLNIAVQRTIDRIVFLRICEDRNIEPYSRLYNNASERNQVYDNLKTIYAEAHDKYNSGLFDFSDEGDSVSLDIHISDDPLQSIIKRLYYPVSPYEFSVLPSDILGQVYERFLGKVIELSDGGQATIEEKPEVRKAGGVYYTPTYIVDYIVENTVGKLVEGKTPDAVSELRVLDPACGSGSFLIGAYEFLMDWHLSYYSEKSPKKALKEKKIRETGDSNNPYALTTDEKKRILTHNLYGVDLDQQAVEVTKLSLLLKMLEDETDASARQFTLFATGERILPDLSDNIKWGNSLIGSDFYSGKQIGMFGDEELYRVKAFDWDVEFDSIMRAGGFDAVIGNPPYGASLTKDEVSYLRNKYQIGSTKDTFAIFIEEADALLKCDGYIGQIVPSGWVSAPSMKKLREVFISDFKPVAFASMPYDVFTDAYVDTIIVVAQKLQDNEPLDNYESSNVDLVVFPIRYKIQSVDEFAEFKKIGDAIKWLQNDGKEFLVTLSTQENEIILKVKNNGSALTDVADVQRGVTPFKTTKEQAEIEINSQRAFKGTIRRYKMIRPDDAYYIRYDNTLAEFKPQRYFKGDRLLLRELISRQFQLQAMYVKDDFITNKSMQSILVTDKAYHILYLLGIINSNLLSWYFLAIHSVGRRDDFPKIVLRQSRSLPFRKIDFDNPDEKAQHDSMVSLVESMLDLHQQLAGAEGQAKKVIEQQIAGTDRKIDTLVYDLYDLSKEEIAIVEGR